MTNYIQVTRKEAQHKDKCFLTQCRPKSKDGDIPCIINSMYFGVAVSLTSWWPGELSEISPLFFLMYGNILIFHFLLNIISSRSSFQ
jgi:hypothetical protein